MLENYREKDFKKAYIKLKTPVPKYIAYMADYGEEHHWLSIFIIYHRISIYDIIINRWDYWTWLGNNWRNKRRKSKEIGRYKKKIKKKWKKKKWKKKNGKKVEKKIGKKILTLTFTLTITLVISN